MLFDSKIKRVKQKLKEVVFAELSSAEQSRGWGKVKS